MTRGERILAALVGAGCLSILSLAAALNPSPDGHGTHTDLGLNPCPWAQALDAPCPTCGMTTSFSHAANFDLAAAAWTQPFGLLLALGTSMVFWGSIHVAAFGSPLGRHVAKLLNAKVLWLVASLGAAAWIWKIAAWPGAG